MIVTFSTGNFSSERWSTAAWAARSCRRTRPGRRRAGIDTDAVMPVQRRTRSPLFRWGPLPAEADQPARTAGRRRAPVRLSGGGGPRRRCPPTPGCGRAGRRPRGSSPGGRARRCRGRRARRGRCPSSGRRRGSRWRVHVGPLAERAVVRPSGGGPGRPSRSDATAAPGGRVARAARRREPAGTSGTTRTRRVPSAKSIVAASGGRRPCGRQVEGPARRPRLRRPPASAPVTSQVPSSPRWASQLTASRSVSISRSRSAMNCCRLTRGRALAQPDPRLAGLLGDPRALLQHGVGEAHDPLDAGARGRGDLLGRLAGADARLDDPGRQLGAEVDVDLGEPAGVAAGGGAQPVVDGQLEALAARRRRGRPRPGSGSSRRRRAPRGAACAWRPPGSCAVRSRRETGARGYRRAAARPRRRPGAARSRPAPACRWPDVDGTIRSLRRRSQCTVRRTLRRGTVALPQRTPTPSSRGGAMASPRDRPRRLVAPARPLGTGRGGIAGAPGAWCPALSPDGQPRRLRHRPLGHPAARGRRRRPARRRPRCSPARTRRSSRSPGRRTAPGWPTW